MNILKEIILVNDYSDISDLQEHLEDYISKNFNSKVKLFKTDKREGLIRARVFGAHKATGDVLIYTFS